MKFLKKFAPKLSSIGVAVYDTAMLPGCVHSAVFTLSVMAANSASAQATTSGHSLTTIFSNWGTTISAIINLVATAGVAIGVGAVLYGIIQMIKKGMGRGDDIEWSNILWPIAGGGLASILMYVLSAVVETSGTGAAMGQGAAAVSGLPVAK